MQFLLDVFEWRWSYPGTRKFWCLISFFLCKTLGSVNFLTSRIGLILIHYSSSLILSFHEHPPRKSIMWCFSAIYRLTPNRGRKADNLWMNAFFEEADRRIICNAALTIDRKSNDFSWFRKIQPSCAAKEEGSCKPPRRVIVNWTQPPKQERPKRSLYSLSFKHRSNALLSQRFLLLQFINTR